jgi:hypothetical protein
MKPNESNKERPSLSKNDPNVNQPLDTNTFVSRDETSTTHGPTLLIQRELILVELTRLRNSVFHLRRTLDELRAADTQDPDILEAIVEDERVLLKQQRQIEELEFELTRIQSEMVGS